MDFKQIMKSVGLESGMVYCQHKVNEFITNNPDVRHLIRAVALTGNGSVFHYDVIGMLNTLISDYIDYTHNVNEGIVNLCNNGSNRIKYTVVWISETLEIAIKSVEDALNNMEASSTNITIDGASVDLETYYRLTNDVDTGISSFIKSEEIFSSLEGLHKVDSTDDTVSEVMDTVSGTFDIIHNGVWRVLELAKTYISLYETAKNDPKLSKDSFDKATKEIIGEGLDSSTMPDNLAGFKPFLDYAGDHDNDGACAIITTEYASESIRNAAIYKRYLTLKKDGKNG